MIRKLKEKSRNVPGRWNKARGILGWLICAKRPLKWHELSSILAYDPDARMIDMDGRSIRVPIDELCGSLVQVLNGDRVQLIHQTAKQ